MASTTLLELRTRARQRADMVSSTFVSDAELTIYVNQGLFELYDQVVASFEDYFTTSTTLTVSSGSTVALPSDFYKLRGLDYNTGGSVYVPVRMFNFMNRNLRQSDPYYYTGGTSREYRIMGTNIQFIPEDGATGSYRLWYVPAATELVGDNDLIQTSLANFGWDEYIVLFAAERMLAKEESDISEVKAQRLEIANRIVRMAANRDVNQTERVTDTQNSFIGLDWWQ
jgi:hypothetical protein